MPKLQKGRLVRVAQSHSQLPGAVDKLKALHLAAELEAARRQKLGCSPEFEDWVEEQDYNWRDT